MLGHRRGAHGFVRAAAAALAVVMGLGACEGDNLFRYSGPVTEGPPGVRQLLVPASAFVGDAIPVTVTATARRGLSNIQIRYRGALDTDQNFGFQQGTDSATVNTNVTVLVAADSLLIVTAVATDVAGRSSPPVTDTVIVRQNPAAPALVARE